MSYKVHTTCTHQVHSNMSYEVKLHAHIRYTLTCQMKYKLHVHIRYTHAKMSYEVHTTCTYQVLFNMSYSHITRFLLMPGQRPGKPPTHAAHIHMSIFMDINILFKIYFTSYSACNISILSIAMTNLQVYEKQNRLILCLNSILEQHLNKC